MKPSLPEIIARADALYAARERVENVLESLELLRSTGRAGDYEIAWRLGRALFFLGQESKSDGERRAFHSEGVHACKRISQDQPGRVEAHFWLGVNLALLAQAEGKSLRALSDALRARSSLKRAAQIDPAYHSAGPLRVLARLEHKLPKIFGGKKRARSNFERAIALAPSNTITRIYFAEMLIDEGKRDEAKAQLEELLSAPNNPDWSFETKRDRRMALEMLKKLDGR